MSGPCLGDGPVYMEVVEHVEESKRIPNSKIESQNQVLWAVIQWFYPSKVYTNIIKSLTYGKLMTETKQHMLRTNAKRTCL